ncbi:MAG: hypothetical protein LC104_16360 [Bacteroidales bacterium]|nr:hypothetical protein [Bacteroidales bacterium]
MHGVPPGTNGAFLTFLLMASVPADIPGERIRPTPNSAVLSDDAWYRSCGSNELHAL